MEQLAFNWVGPYDKLEGYGLLNYKLLQAVARNGLKVTPLTYDQFADWSNDIFRIAGIDANRPLFHVGVISAPDENQPFFLVNKLPARHMLYTMYESTALPEAWSTLIDRFVERVFTPSEFCANLFADNLPNTPVHLVPPGIDPDELKPVINWPDRPFTFMCLADRGNRKGSDLVWRAFWDEFSNDPNVRLIIKARPKNIVYLREAFSDYRISIWRSDIKDSADIYTTADCFVFPSRGEGYGFPPREAAACGIPVISTDHTGLADDHEHWALPVKSFERPVPKNLLYGGGNWFEPDLPDLKRQMRWVYDHRLEAQAFGKQASDWLRTNRTWDHSAKTLIPVLQRVAYDSIHGMGA